MRVRLLSRANRELAATSDFYLKEAGPRIAERFLDEVKSISAHIGENYEQYHSYKGHVRVARLITFPYSLFFRVRQDEIVVVAVSHNSRRPDYWRDRVH